MSLATKNGLPSLMGLQGLPSLMVLRGLPSLMGLRGLLFLTMPLQHTREIHCIDVRHGDKREWLQAHVLREAKPNNIRRGQGMIKGGTKQCVVKSNCHIRVS
jgi:hypothetical protein